jgi:4-oxalocrotonate tautomerase
MRRYIMPVITIEGPFLPLEKKERLAREMAQLASDITQIPKEAFVIFVKENAYENMSQGGVLISEKLKNL